MKLRTASLGVLAMAALLIAPSVTNAQDDAKKNKAAAADPMGYFLGVSVGQTMLQQGFKAGDFKPDSMAAGVVDALSERDIALTDEELQEVRSKIEKLLRARQADVQKRQEAVMADMKKKADANKERGLAWLKENGEKKGIKSLDGGLQYKVIEEGSGGSPSASDTVKVHYTGTLTNGKVFDSSVQRGQPAQFQVNRVIKGWQMALQKMKVGDKWMLYIPPDLAYGERGSGGTIGPNEVLVFEVELLDII